MICDISEFYGRINHHRIENALQHVNSTGISKKIMEIYKIFSDTYSVGIPVGGPASRIISELVLDQVDKLLVYAKIEFCRFSDDYHIFADSYEEAFKSLDELGDGAKDAVIIKITDMINNGSYIVGLDIHMSVALRVICKRKTFENEELLDRVYRASSNEIVRRDIILIMARWNSWQWLSDRRLAFRSLSFPERRALIVASYKLKDEGRHWRDGVKREFTPLETLVREWASEKVNLIDWQVPV